MWDKITGCFCVFVNPMSLACSHVVSFSDSSHQQQQTSAGNVCRRVCAWVCVCVLYILHREARGLRWNHGATATTRRPPPRSPHTPLAFCSSPGWQPCIRQTHSHRLCCKPPASESTHTHIRLHQPPPALGRSIQLFAFHLTTALEELRFLKKTQYSIPSPGSLFCMCEACLHVHPFVNENVWGRAAEKERIHAAAIQLLKTADKYKLFD